MSFFDDIFDLGSSLLSGAISVVSDKGIIGSLARTAVTSLVMNQLNSQTNRSNESPGGGAATAPTPVNPGAPGGGSGVVTPPPVDPGVRIQLEPNASNRIPVLYGTAFIPGMITDAYLSADQKTMNVVLTLAERTGVKISDNLSSAYTFTDVFMDDQEVTFASGGVMVASSLDRDGNADTSAAGLVAIRVYAGSSAAAHQLGQVGGPSITPIAAYDVIPEWDSLYTMSNLLFAVITVTYNAEKGINKIPKFLFHMTNSMHLPGDCLYDYSTNTLYGAGLLPEDVFRE